MPLFVFQAFGGCGAGLRIEDTDIIVSECHVEGYTHSFTVYSRGGTVGEPPYVVDAQTFEQVVDAHTSFHVGPSVHWGGMGLVGENIEIVAVAGLVFIAQRAKISQ